MAHFYGSVKGDRGETTRCGTRNSGLKTIAASWEGAIEVVLEERQDCDHVTVTLIPWGQERFTPKVLYSGRIRDLPDTRTR